jgi:hypothetical protein
MGTNGPVWDAAWGGEVTKSGEPVTGGRRASRKGGKKRRSRRGGADEVDIPSAPPSIPEQAPPAEKLKKDGGRKSRKSRKGGKKSRKVSRRKMRGGGSVGIVGASFTGEGSRGMADYKPYASNVPVGGAFAIPTGTR